VRHLVQQLATRFIDHYYPTMLKYDVTRPKRELKVIRNNFLAIIAHDGIEGIKRAIHKNYRKHLGDEVGIREAEAFILSVKDLLAELTLTED
jgi:hypothetical protein